MSVLKFVLLALVPAAVICGTGSNTTELRDAYRVIAGSNLNFTNALYQVMASTEGNLLFSPLSIQVILALAAQGARGETQREMISGLRLPQEQQTTKDGFRQLLKVLRTNDGDSVKIANKVYTDLKFPPTAEFIRIAKDSFFSDGQEVDFEKEVDNTRQKINQWVAANTANKIEEMLSDGVLEAGTHMVLVNAVYFKGTWSTQFNPEKTKPKLFHVSRQLQKTVSMMHVNVVDNFAFKESEELDAKILEIPYVGNSMSLVIILPNKKFGLRGVETKLARTDIRQLFKQMQTPEIHVMLPKFKLEQSLDLAEHLRQMGMNRMFDSSANFSGISAGPIKISKVVHKAYIDINEEGAEAAAATAVRFTKRRGQPANILFDADHPFIFFLCHSEINPETHDQDRSIVFMGRFLEPLG